MSADDGVILPEDAIADEAGLLPEAPRRELGAESFSAQASRSATAVTQQHNEALASGRAVIAMPNGEYGFLDEDEQWIGDHQYLAGKHKSLFADAAQLLKD